MNGKRHKPEQIIQKLRHAEIEISKRATVPPGGQEDRGDRADLLPMAQ